MNTYVFDLDGTIVLNGKPVSDDITTALMDIRLHGQVIFASARPVRDMLPLLSESLHDCLMIGCNGGMAWRNGEFIFSNSFEDIHARDLIDTLKKLSIPYVLDGLWNYSISDTPHYFHQYLGTLSEKKAEEEQIVAEGISKILILDSKARKHMDYLFEKRKYSFNIHHHKSDDLFDITPQAENKYLALKRLGVNFRTTTAFGNDANDFAMLKHANIAVFLGMKDDFKDADYYGSVTDLPILLKDICSLGVNEPDLL